MAYRITRQLIITLHDAECPFLQYKWKRERIVNDKKVSGIVSPRFCYCFCHSFLWDLWQFRILLRCCYHFLCLEGCCWKTSRLYLLKTDKIVWKADTNLGASTWGQTVNFNLSYIGMKIMIILIPSMMIAASAYCLLISSLSIAVFQNYSQVPLKVLR